MRRPNRARRHRSFRARQRVKPGWGLTVFLIFLLCAAVLFTVAVLLGTYLKRISDDTSDTYNPVTAAEMTEPGRYSSSRVPVIIAEYADNSAICAGSVVSFTKIPEETLPVGSSATDTSGETLTVKPNAVSLLLRTADTSAEPEETDSSAASVRSGTGMRLLYTSGLATSRSFDVSGGEEISTLISTAKQSFGFVSGVFTVMFQNEPSSSRSIIREYELSLLCELFENGIDDVVLTGFDAGNFRQAVAFVRDLSDRTGKKANIGIALDFSFYNSEDVRTIIAGSGFDCGFLAVNLAASEIPGLMTPEEVIFDRVGRIISTISLYNVRVLVGCGPNTGLSGEMSAAMRAGALNIQAVGKPDITR